MKALITTIIAEEIDIQDKIPPYGVTMSYRVDFVGTGDLSKYVEILRNQKRDLLQEHLFELLQTVELNEFILPNK